MKICMFLRSFAIFDNGIFTLKNEIVEQADFSSDWRKLRFRGLEI